MRPRRRSRTRFRRWPNTSGPVETLLILAVIAVAVGVTVGLLLPNISPTIGKLTGRFTATGPAADALNTLTVDDHPDSSGYDRQLFGYRETDVDGNGCDVRDDVLARDLTDVRYRRGSCIVESGTLDDPYTGATIHFQRGRTTSSAVQIDHVVALENAWQSGARHWDQATRFRFGNDMSNLIAVDGPANNAKGSASAAYWLPTNGAYRCDYVARQIAVKQEYGLTVTSAERDAMRAVLHTCPAQQLPEQ